MSDDYGRRPAFRVATLLVVVFGVFTTFAAGFWWLLLFRTCVGIGAGGMEVPFDLLGEIVTQKEKSRYVFRVCSVKRKFVFFVVAHFPTEVN